MTEAVERIFSRTPTTISTATEAINHKTETVKLLARHPPILMVQQNLKETRELPDTDDKWKRLDFLEQYVLSRLSNDIEVTEHKALRKDLPAVRRIRLKDPTRRAEFNKLWSDFKAAGAQNPTEATPILNQLYEFWRANAYGFGRKRKV